MDAISNLIGATLVQLAVAFTFAVALFAALLIYFQRDRTGQTVWGIVRTIGSLFTGPARYIRLLLNRVAEMGARTQSDPAGERHVLSKRLLLFGHLATVIIGLFLLSSGAATGWLQMVPSRSLVASYKKSVATQESLRQTILQKEITLAREDSIWRADSTRMISEYARALKATIAQRDSSRHAIRQQIGGRPAAARQQLLEIIGNLDEKPDYYNDREWGQRNERLIGALQNTLASIQPMALAQLGFRNEDPGLLRNYLHHWTEGRSASATLRSWPSYNARRLLQEYRFVLNDELDDLRPRLESVQEEVRILREATRWRPSRFFVRTFMGLVAAFFFIWILGFLFESASVVFDMADNLRRLRVRFDPSEVDETSG